MLARLLLGLLKGLLIGGAVAAGLVFGLGLGVVSAWFLAYPLAMLVGTLTGFIAGRPIWAPGARVEAYLKGAAGALLAAGLLFVMRTWLAVPLPELPLGLGGGASLSDVPVVALPLISTLLALLFDLDNSGAEPETKPEGKRVADASKVRVLRDEEPPVDADILAEIERELEMERKAERKERR